MIDILLALAYTLIFWNMVDIWRLRAELRDTRQRTPRILGCPSREVRRQVEIATIEGPVRRKLQKRLDILQTHTDLTTEVNKMDILAVHGHDRIVLLGCFPVSGKNGCFSLSVDAVRREKYKSIRQIPQVTILDTHLNLDGI